MSARFAHVLVSLSNATAVDQANTATFEKAVPALSHLAVGALESIISLFIITCALAVIARPPGHCPLAAALDRDDGLGPWAQSHGARRRLQGQG